MSLPSIRSILMSGKQAGFSYRIMSDGEIDYEGINLNEAMNAICGVDECHAYLLNSDGSTDSYLFIVWDTDPNEEICDYSMTGFIGQHLKAYS